jgi:hypothetical protein
MLFLRIVFGIVKNFFGRLVDSLDDGTGDAASERHAEAEQETVLDGENVFDGELCWVIHCFPLSWLKKPNAVIGIWL